MKNQNFNKGRAGEDKAKSYLENLGQKILFQNYSNCLGEIDIITLDKNTLVFVEVKYKSNHDLGEPEDMISNHKINQIIKTANGFITEYQQYKNYPFRLDAICIVGSDIKHYKNLTG